MPNKAGRRPKSKSKSNINVPALVGSNKKRFIYNEDDEYGMPILRFWHRKAAKKKSPSMLVKCGCCDEKVEIYYDAFPHNEFPSIEINGVIASVNEWRKVLMPLIGAGE